MDYKNIISEVIEKSNGKRVEIFNVGEVDIFDIIKYRSSFLKLTKALHELKRDKIIHEFAYSNDTTKYKHNRPIIVFKC